jgi:hypothetical protein
VGLPLVFTLPKFFIGLPVFGLHSRFSDWRRQQPRLQNGPTFVDAADEELVQSDNFLLGFQTLLER